MLVYFKLKPFYIYTDEGKLDEIYDMFEPYIGGGVLIMLTRPDDPHGMEIGLSVKVPDIRRVMNSTLDAMKKRAEYDDHGIIDVRVVINDGREVEETQGDFLVEYMLGERGFPPVKMYSNYKDELTIRWTFTANLEDFCNIINSYVVRF